MHHWRKASFIDHILTIVSPYLLCTFHRHHVYTSKRNITHEIDNINTEHIDDIAIFLIQLFFSCSIKFWISTSTVPANHKNIWLWECYI